ncbi:hypothetical protein Pmani_037812, partial [Petrolisthes manimaculis]
CRVEFFRSPTHTKFVNLTVIEPPKSVVLKDQKQGVPKDGQLGPYQEGVMIVFTCLARGGVPLPNVTWWRRGKPLDVSWELSGPGLVMNDLVVSRLTRDWHDDTLSCTATNSPLLPPVIVNATILMHHKACQHQLLRTDFRNGVGRGSSVTPRTKQHQHQHTTGREAGRGMGYWLDAGVARRVIVVKLSVVVTAEAHAGVEEGEVKEEEVQEVKVKVEVEGEVQEVKENEVEVEGGMEEVKENEVEVEGGMEGVKENEVEVEGGMEGVKENEVEVEGGMEGVKENEVEVEGGMEGVKENEVEVEGGMEGVKENEVEVEVKVEMEEVKGKNEGDGGRGNAGSDSG